MNTLADCYGPKDWRYESAKLIDTVLPYATEQLANGVGGTITLLPLNDCEDITAIYRGASGGVLIGQMNLHSEEATSVDIPEDQIPALLAAIGNPMQTP